MVGSNLIYQTYFLSMLTFFSQRVNCWVRSPGVDGGGGSNGDTAGENWNTPGCSGGGGGTSGPVKVEKKE